MNLKKDWGMQEEFQGGKGRYDVNKRFTYKFLKIRNKLNKKKA